jgi:soluble lytic murein transglycosylase
VCAFVFVLTDASPAAAQAERCKTLPEEQRVGCEGMHRGRARLLSDAPDPAGDADLFDNLRRALDEVPGARAHAHVLAARVAAHLDMADAAVDWLEDKSIARSKDPLMPFRVARARAEVAAALKDHTAEAAAWRDALVALKKRKRFGSLLDEEPPAVLVKLIRALEWADDAEGARAAERELLAGWPAHPAARGRESKLDDGSLLLDDRQRMRRAKNLLDSARYTRLLKELEHPAAKKAVGEARVQLDIIRAEVLVWADRTDEAVAMLAPLARQAGASDAYKKKHAWALAKAGRHKDASLAYEALAGKTKDEGLSQQACFFSGFSLYEAGDHAGARVYFSGCARLLGDSSWGAAAIWYGALTSMLDGDWGAVEIELTELRDRWRTHAEDDKHRYWLAVAHMKMGKEAKGRALLKGLARGAPETWYGQLARRRLGLSAVPGVKVPRDALAATAAADKKAGVARTLWAVGDDLAAKRVARARGHKRRDLGLSQSLDDYLWPYRNGGRQRPWPAVKKGELRASAGWRASFAAPWADLVEKACAKHGLEPAFAWAIMRNESGFYPDANSAVGARGLMQLMPYSAAGMAKKLGKSAPHPDSLTQPAVSIDYGVAFLATSTKELGHPALAAAAYNGGPENVAAWMEGFGHLDPELFVERVPFRESRDYIKHVLPAMALYRALDGAPLLVDFPTKPFGKPPKEYTWFPRVPAE